MSTLWNEESTEVWTQQLARESAIVEASGKERLADLERCVTSSLWGGFVSRTRSAGFATRSTGRLSAATGVWGRAGRWWREELGPELCARQPRHMRAAELVKLVEWKLVRGKWRPKLLNYAKEQGEDAVVAASTEALQQLGQGDVKAALLRLCKLKGAANATILAAVCPTVDSRHCGRVRAGESRCGDGAAGTGVGVATASAVLACVDESCPFMSDEALAAALPGEKKYTLPQYLELRAALRAKAEQLSAQRQDDGLSPTQLERALWLHALEKAPKKKPASKKAAGQAGRKRKRR